VESARTDSDLSIAGREFKSVLSLLNLKQFFEIPDKVTLNFDLQKGVAVGGRPWTLIRPHNVLRRFAA
jgi:hypothetical protein